MTPFSAIHAFDEWEGNLKLSSASTLTLEEKTNVFNE
jgi:hypothetical protein